MRPVVIVDPLSSGVELAPAFRARGIPAIAVTLPTNEWPEFGSRLRRGDFVAILEDRHGLAQILRAYDPIAVLPGTEEAIPLAESLTAELVPRFANDPALAKHRSDKSLMQSALRGAGVPSLATILTASEDEAATWISTNPGGLVLKPPASSGSEMVFHVDEGGDWRTPFRHILAEPSVVTGSRSDSVVVQEQAVGTEYALGTVSADGRHSLVHLIRYHKVALAGRKTVYDYVEFIPFDHGELWDYARAALDALGVRWGATHTEIIVTERGPRLIETSARMIGGPVVDFARAATGSSQADRLVDICAGGPPPPEIFPFRQTVVPVFLRASAAGVISNLQALDRAAGLPSLLHRYVWVSEGDRVPRTVDYLTNIGIVALAGDPRAIAADYKQIRLMEAQLAFRP